MGDGRIFVIHLLLKMISRNTNIALSLYSLLVVRTMSPKVSIIVPCYNEQSTILSMLQAFHVQTFPRAQMEVVIADGMSTDGTRAAIAAFQREFPDLEVRVVENVKRFIPSGVNRAIEVARGEILVRFDGHAKPYPDYV